MPTPVAGSIGGRLDLLVRQNTTLGPFVATVRDSAGVVVNLTGCTFAGKVIDKNSATTHTLVFSTPNLAGGQVTFSAPTATTVAFEAPGGRKNPTAQYEYIINITYPDSRVETLLYGDVLTASQLP